MPSTPFSRHRLHRNLVATSVALTITGCATQAAMPSDTPALPLPASTESAQPPQAEGSSLEPAGVGQAFAVWIRDFRVTAKAAGIRESTLDAALADVQYLPHVIERDRSQSEFTRTVWDYLDTAVSPGRIARGQERLFEVRAAADDASARYGVPAPVLVAIWGMESNYGGNYGNVSVIDALATLGADGRRAAWARTQLLAALTILQNGDIDRQRMVGSWAGAMGQTQFLPSNFLAYAVDADGDGRRDIWGSMPDVLASTANFLARSGWRSGQPWGTEVRLPQGFDAGRADPDIRQAGATWAAEGIHSVDGTALPDLPDSAVWLPAGAGGPAFLVGPNFRTLLRYNNATSYALAVGLLAQQLAGGPGVQADWPRDLSPLSRNQIEALQTALNGRGFTSGKPDGVVGPATRAAVRSFQRSVGIPADGYPTTGLLQQLQLP